MNPFTWTPESSNAAPPAQLVEALVGLEVALLPTDTIYGFHARADNDKAVERIYQIKLRDRGNPLPVLFTSIEQMQAHGVVASRTTLERLGSLWPAPLTAILPLASPLAATAGTPTVAARIPDLTWLRTLIERTGPLASTSANRSGQRPARSVVEIDSSLLRLVASIVDAGHLEGQPSTLVDFTQSSPRVVRMGAFSFTQNLWKTL